MNYQHEVSLCIFTLLTRLPESILISFGFYPFRFLVQHMCVGVQPAQPSAVSPAETVLGWNPRGELDECVSHLCGDYACGTCISKVTQTRRLASTEEIVTIIIIVTEQSHYWPW